MMKNRAYHHGDLRAALLARATAEIDDRGADALSLRRLARDLGVSHGASARHFRDRAALLDAVALAGFTRLTQQMRASDDADPLVVAARAYVEFAVQHPHRLSAMYAAKRAAGVTQELLDAGHGAFAFVVELIEKAQAAGRVRAGDAATQARIVFTSVHGVAMLAIDGLLEVSPEQAVDEMIRFVSIALRPEDTTPSP